MVSCAMYPSFIKHWDKVLSKMDAPRSYDLLGHHCIIKAEDIMLQWWLFLSSSA